MILEETHTTFSLIADNIYQIIIMVALLGLQSIVNWLKNQKPKKEMKITLESIAAKVQSMESELKTNGGSSLKDVVNKTHADVKNLHDKVEKVIAQERARTELALDASIVAQFLADEIGNITFANNAFAELFGLGKNHVTKRKWLVAIEAQEIKEDLVERMEYALKNEFSFKYDVDIKSQREPYKSTFTRLTVERKLDINGRFLWNLGMFREIPKNDKKND